MNWFDCLKPLVNAEHTEKVQALLASKIHDSDIGDQWQLNIELLLKMALNLAANGQQADAKKYLTDLKRVLHDILFDKLDIEVSREQPGIAGVAFVFNKRRHGSGSSFVPVEALRLFVQEQYEYLASRSKMTTDDAVIQEFIFFEGIMEYLEPFKSSRIAFEEYVTLRKPYIEDPDSLRANMSGWVKGDVPQLLDTFPKQLLAIEKQVIAGLLT